MKTIDINQKSFPSIVDKISSQYLGPVSTVSLEDSQTVFAAYTIGHGRGQCVLKKSKNRGATWSDRLPVPESWSTLLQVPTLFRVSKHDGKQRLLMITGHYPVRQSISDDDGSTWTELNPIGEFGANVAMGSLIQTKGGRILAFFHDDGRYLTKKSALRYELHRLRDEAEAQILFYRESYFHKPKNISYDEFTRSFRGKESCDGEYKELMLDPSTLNEGEQEPEIPPGCIYSSSAGKRHSSMNGKIYMCVSDDAGTTWAPPELIAEEPGLFLGEPGAFLSPNEEEISIIMLEHNSKKESYIISSSDMGKKWTSPQVVHPALNGFRHTVRQLPDNRLLIVYGTREASTFPRDVVAWIGDYSSLKNNSDDFQLVRIKENQGTDFGYSGVEVFPDGECLVTSYGSWERPEQRPYLISVGFDAMNL